MKPGHLFNVIGIVRGRKAPYKTRNGGKFTTVDVRSCCLVAVDWSITIHLQDPTSFEDPDYPPTDFSIVFFQGNFKEWLPQADAGDVLILHNIRVSTTFPWYTTSLTASRCKITMVYLVSAIRIERNGRLFP